MLQWYLVGTLLLLLDFEHDVALARSSSAERRHANDDDLAVREEPAESDRRFFRRDPKRRAVHVDAHGSLFGEQDNDGLRRSQRAPTSLLEVEARPGFDSLLLEDAPAKSASTPPMLLHVVVSVEPEVSGNYSLIHGQDANGFPVWRQEVSGSDAGISRHWLFSGTSRRWMIGGPAAERKGFACSDCGSFASRTDHGGSWPGDVAAVDWLYFKRGRWRSTPAGCIQIESPSARGPASASEALPAAPRSRESTELPVPLLDFAASQSARSPTGVEAAEDSQHRVQLELKDASLVKYQGVNAWDVEHGSLAVAEDDSDNDFLRIHQDYTHCAWVRWRRGDVKSRDLFSCDNGDRTIAINAHSRNLGFYCNGCGGFRSASFEIELDIWNFVCSVGRGHLSKGHQGTSEYYLATVADSAVRSVGKADRVASGNFVSSIGDAEHSPGKVALVKVWNAALSLKQLDAIFESTKHLVAGDSTNSSSLLPKASKSKRLKDARPAGACKPCREVVSLIGPVTDKAIPDSAILASSFLRNSSIHGFGDMQRSRTDWGEATWTAASRELGEFVQASFGKKVRVTHVTTKGRHDANEWVEEYKIGIGDLAAAGHTEVLLGNVDNDEAVTNALHTPLEDSYLRLFPVRWHGRISLRWDLKGCLCEPIRPADRSPNSAVCGRCGDSNPVRPLIGDSFEAAVPDLALSASSYRTNNTEFGMGSMWRLRMDNHNSSWASGREQQGEYVEIRFTGMKRITSVVTKGRFDADEWVTSYQLGDSWPISTDSAASTPPLIGNTDRYLAAERWLAKPLEVDRVRLFPLTWHGYPSMRLEIMGCDCLPSSGRDEAVSLIDGGATDPALAPDAEDTARPVMRPWGEGLRLKFTSVGKLKSCSNKALIKLAVSTELSVYDCSAACEREKDCVGFGYQSHCRSSYFFGNRDPVLGRVEDGSCVLWSGYCLEVEDECWDQYLMESQAFASIGTGNCIDENTDLMSSYYKQEVATSIGCANDCTMTLECHAYQYIGHECLLRVSPFRTPFIQGYLKGEEEFAKTVIKTDGSAGSGECMKKYSCTPLIREAGDVPGKLRSLADLEADWKKTDYVRIEWGMQKYIQFRPRTSIFFAGTLRTQLTDLENFSTSEATLQGWVANAGGARFCLAGLSHQTTWAIIPKDLPIGDLGCGSSDDLRGAFYGTKSHPGWVGVLDRRDAPYPTFKSPEEVSMRLEWQVVDMKDYQAAALRHATESSLAKLAGIATSKVVCELICESGCRDWPREYRLPKPKPEAVEKLLPQLQGVIGDSATRSALGTAMDTAGSALGTTVQTAGSVVGTTMDTAGSALGTTVQTAGSVVGTTMDTAGSALGTTVQTAGSVVGTTMDTAGSALKTAKTTAKDVSGSVTKKVTKLKPKKKTKKGFWLLARGDGDSFAGVDEKRGRVFPAFGGGGFRRADEAPPAVLHQHAQLVDAPPGTRGAFVADCSARPHSHAQGTHIKQAFKDTKIKKLLRQMALEYVGETDYYLDTETAQVRKLHDDEPVKVGEDVMVWEQHHLFLADAEPMFDGLQDAMSACGQRPGGKPVGNYVSSAGERNSCGGAIVQFKKTPQGGSSWSKLMEAGPTGVFVGNRGRDDAHCGVGHKRYVGACGSKEDEWCSLGLKQCGGGSCSFVCAAQQKYTSLKFTVQRNRASQSQGDFCIAEMEFSLGGSLMNSTEVVNEGSVEEQGPAAGFDMNPKTFWLGTLGEGALLKFAKPAAPSHFRFGVCVGTGGSHSPASWLMEGSEDDEHFTVLHRQEANYDTPSSGISAWFNLQEPEWYVGDVVDALRSDGYWHMATIKEDLADGTFKVAYYRGSSEDTIRSLGQIRRYMERTPAPTSESEAPQEGDAVEALSTDDQEWYPAQVESLEATDGNIMYKIRWEDAATGENDTAKRKSEVRKRRCPATCEGYTCDDWVEAGQLCRDLETKIGCDCFGCKACESADTRAPTESDAESLLRVDARQLREQATALLQIGDQLHELSHRRRQEPEDSAEPRADDDDQEAIATKDSNASGATKQEADDEHYLKPEENETDVEEEADDEQPQHGNEKDLKPEENDTDVEEEADDEQPQQGKEKDLKPEENDTDVEEEADDEQPQQGKEEDLKPEENETDVEEEADDEQPQQGKEEDLKPEENETDVEEEADDEQPQQGKEKDLKPEENGTDVEEEAGGDERQKAEKDPVNPEGGSTHSENQDYIEMRFDLDYDATNHSQFKAELKQSYLDLGMPKAIVDSLHITLRAGSIIAETYADAEVLAQMRKADLRKVTVMGANANVRPSDSPPSSGTEGEAEDAVQSDGNASIEDGEDIEVESLVLGANVGMRLSICSGHSLKATDEAEEEAYEDYDSVAIEDFRGVPDAGTTGRDPGKPCMQKLIGSGFYQEVIPDKNIQASSEKYPCSVSQSRLFLKGCHCWSDRDLQRWIQWDLGEVMLVEAIQTQGSPLENSYVQSFFIEYTETGYSWQKVMKGNSSQKATFAGNSNGNDVVENRFDVPFRARYVRLTAKNIVGMGAIRAELLGCAPRWMSPDKLLIGDVGLLRFDLMYPRNLDGRLFYYVDANGDGTGMDPKAVQADMISVTTVTSYLPMGVQRLSSASKELRVMGNVFSVPNATEMQQLLVGAAAARGHEWPGSRVYASSDVQNNMRWAVDGGTQRIYKDRSDDDGYLLALELVQLPGQDRFVKFSGKCTSRTGRRSEHDSPQRWLDGSSTFAGSAKLGGIVMCMNFCQAKAPECKGFDFDRHTQSCYWLRGDIDRGDDAEGFDCYISSLFKCARFDGYGACGEEYLRDTMVEWCDTACTREQCCTDRGVCTQVACGVDKTLRNSSGLCAGSLCTEEECCEDLGRCTEAACPMPAWRLNLGNLPQYCAGSTCTEQECCLGNLACKEEDCPAPFALISEEPIFCSSQEKCALMECCKEVATCKSVTCPLVSRPKSKETLCASRTCEVEECCDKLGDCKTDKVCPAGFRLKPEDELPSGCDGAVCTINECCHNVAQCVQEVCQPAGRLGFTLKTFSSVFCKDIHCTPEECCKPAGRCDQFDCGRGYRLLKHIEGRPEFCRDAACTREECCRQQGQCTGNVCPHNWNWKKARSLPLFCHDEQCLPEECCERLGVCTADICGDGFRKKARYPEACQKTECTVKECCMKVATCSDQPDICTKGRGYIAKASPPEVCQEFYCNIEECCDVAGLCTHDLCGPDEAASLQVYCKGKECTREECCEKRVDAVNVDKASLLAADTKVEEGKGDSEDAVEESELKSCSQCGKTIRLWLFIGLMGGFVRS
eukprot:TRINITY_DN3348_c0_g1_i3.p1 TRINITY_DN3348_c0_g1~~TRINITY_DN3348_c0_g1_i3.p1  ORF type:complete len:3281 (-),score=663.61 TRINITY_DN3348_c0_g1_i3:114-9956(-)